MLLKWHLACFLMAAKHGVFSMAASWTTVHNFSKGEAVYGMP